MTLWVESSPIVIQRHVGLFPQLPPKKAHIRCLSSYIPLRKSFCDRAPDLPTLNRELALPETVSLAQFEKNVFALRTLEKNGSNQGNVSQLPRPNIKQRVKRISSDQRDGSRRRNFLNLLRPTN